MSRKKFTEEQIRALSDNPYTFKVTSSHIYFTAEFKQLFWEDHCHGLQASQILEQYGYDTDILGPIRVRSIAQRICREAEQAKGFSDGRPVFDPDAKTQHDSEAKIAKLEHEVKYLKQEIEFLKKTISIRSTRK